MKTALITSTLLTLLATPVLAREIPATATRQAYTCEGGGLSRVVARSQPAPCCEGMLGCPQMLGNSSPAVVRKMKRT
jgi:hypothetical protein